jgi:hypothetical protein
MVPPPEISATAAEVKLPLVRLTVPLGTLLLVGYVTCTATVRGALEAIMEDEGESITIGVTTFPVSVTVADVLAV